MKKVLITGAFGQFGLVLKELLSNKFELLLTTYRLPSNITYSNSLIEQLNVTHLDDVKSAFESFNPDFIINCAAITNVDFCENNHNRARIVNAKGVDNITKCMSKNMKLVHISTDYVFDGSLESAYVETDPTHPVNYYGKSKLEAENIIRGSNINWSIIRASMLYGAPLSSKQNFFSWVYDSLLKNKSINVIDDIFSNPAWMPELGEIVLKIMLLDANGIFHYGSSDVISRFDFANKIADVFDLDPGFINPISIRDIDFDARRPKNTSLSNERIKTLFGLEPFTVEHCLCKIKESRIVV